MKKHLLKYWVSGTFLAFSGVLFVRVISEWYAQPAKGWLQLIGYNIAFAGLFVIMLGTRKKHKEREAAEKKDTPES